MLINVKMPTVVSNLNLKEYNPEARIVMFAWMCVYTVIMKVIIPQPVYDSDVR